MTRLPWQHSRSRTRSGSEKANSNHPQDWFSRSTAEPSRQAVADLVKAHNRMKSDGSNTSRSSSRPRTSTVTSSHSQGRSSRPRLSGDRTRSRSSSQCTHEEHAISPVDRPDVSSKALLGKGGILLRRTSSILSLSSAASSSTLGLTSPPRSSRASSAASRHDDLRSRISQPFDFQHITHTEDTQFTGLGRIDESTLADQYVAATTQQPDTTFNGLRGIAASDIHSSSSEEPSQPTSPERPVSVMKVSTALPQTPPRPMPPPKDERTTSHSLADQGFESAGLMWLATNSEPPSDKSTSRYSTCPSELVSKPLPELPVVHAITTEDDTAREMIASPLPSPPLPTSPLFGSMTLPSFQSHHQRPSLTLRNQHLYPTAKSSMPNLLAVQHSLTAPRQLARHHSDMSLSQQVKAMPVTVSTRTSVSFAAIDIMNWEDAVDQAWDDVDNDACATSVHEIPTEMPPIESASSTPLMMMTSSNILAMSPNRVSSSVNLEVRQLESVKEDEPIIDLTGLGISSCPASSTFTNVARPSRSSSINFSKRRSSSCCHVNETLTRSSSQESFILSIASSMGGTQRSSNSSVSVADITNMYDSHVGDCAYNEHDDCDDKHAGAARPESGCLPPDILDQISQFGATFAADQASRAEHIPPIPPLPQEGYPRSSTRLSVPERRSSIVATAITPSGRKRSSTWGNRPRQSSHPSYSLFPSVQPVSAYTAVTSS